MLCAADSVIGKECVIWTLNLKGVIVDCDTSDMFYTVISGNDEWFIPMWMVAVDEGIETDD